MTVSPAELLFTPPTRVREGAYFSSIDSYRQLYSRSLADPETFWREQAETLIDWFHPFTQVSDCDLTSGVVAWFLGGKLNLSHNCIDRHLQTRGDKVAILWEGDEPGDVRRITYRELHRQVCRLANVLRHHGIRKGDRVAIYMPMIPEAAFAMLACARIGAVHNVVFAGFSAEALRDRIQDARCKAVITADEGRRGKKIIPLKRPVDEAVMACPTVEHVFMIRHTGIKVPFYEPRDIDLGQAMQSERPYCPVEHMDSEDTLFLLYTSGSTGKPKGIAHTTAGYLLYTMLTHRYVFDYREDDIFACVATSAGSPATATWSTARWPTAPPR